MSYQIGIFADFKGFCISVIEITQKQEIAVFQEFYGKSSLLEIGKAIKKIQEKFSLFDCNISALKPLEIYLDSIGVYYHCLPLDIPAGVFLIACLCNDERLIIHESLKTSYLEELAAFDIDITSHRLNALSLAIGTLDLGSMLGT